MEIVLIGEQIRKNKIRTNILLSVMVLLILILSLAIGYLMDDPLTGLVIGLLIAGFYFLFNFLLFKQMVIGMVRGRKATYDSHPEVMNLVEGLSIAAGIPIPEVYILPTRVPNAFATGFSPEKAIIGVTEGLLEIMNRQELEGVIAHEITHIRNYDVRVSAIALCLGIALIYLSEFFFRITPFFKGASSRSRNNKHQQAAAIIILIGLLIAVFSGLISLLIRMSISRKREYMADAGAVSICGYADGLASALGKLSDQKTYTKKQVHELGGKEMIGFYIHNPLSGLFATHPPIEKRIEILERLY